MNAVLKEELDSNVRSCGFAAPKEWMQINVGGVDTYIGDGTIVVGMINILPKTMKAMERNNKKAEKTIVKYLQAEGFIGKEYVYMGLQKFDLQRLPKGV